MKQAPTLMLDICALLNQGPKTVPELTKELLAHKSTVSAHIRHLHDLGSIHIGDHRLIHGQWVKVWVYGSGDDAIMPPKASPRAKETEKAKKKNRIKSRVISLVAANGSEYKSAERTPVVLPKTRGPWAWLLSKASEGNDGNDARGQSKSSSQEAV